MARRLLSYRLSEILDECKKFNAISGVYFQRKYSMNYESSQKIVKLLIENIVIGDENPKISEIISLPISHRKKQESCKTQDDLNEMKNALRNYKEEIFDILKEIDKSKNRLEKLVENIESAL